MSVFHPLSPPASSVATLPSSSLCLLSTSIEPRVRNLFFMVRSSVSFSNVKECQQGKATTAAAAGWMGGMYINLVELPPSPCLAALVNDTRTGRSEETDPPSESLLQRRRSTGMRRLARRGRNIPNYSEKMHTYTGSHGAHVHLRSFYF